MMLMLQSVQEPQRKISEDKESKDGVEVVRTGAPDLPTLGERTATDGPIPMMDWLTTLEPAILISARLQRSGGRNSRRRCRSGMESTCFHLWRGQDIDLFHHHSFSSEDGRGWRGVASMLLQKPRKRS